MPAVFICEILKRHTTSFYLAVNLFLLAMRSSVSLFSYMSYVHNPCVFYKVAIRLEVCLAIAGVANQSGIKCHISYCVTAKSHIIHMVTHENHPIFSLLTHISLLC